MERFTFTKDSAIGPYMGTDPNGVWCEWPVANARIAALESQVKTLTEERDAQAEAVRVLGNELSGWRCGGLVHMGATPGYQSSGGIGVAKLKYFDCSTETDANPIASAAVEGG